MKLTKGISIFLVLVFLAAAAVPAMAGAPDKITIPYSDATYGDCGDFIVAYEYTGTITLVDHLDQGFVNVHNSFQDKFFRTDGVGEVYTHVEQNSAKWIESGEELHGITWHMVIPGHGTIFIVAGHILIDWETGEAVFVHGNDHKHFDFEKFCAAFAE